MIDSKMNAMPDCRISFLAGRWVFANGQMGSRSGERASPAVLAAVEVCMTRPAALVRAVGMTTTTLLQWVGIAVAVGVLLAVLGPFGSYMNGGPVRLAGYWISAMLLGLALYGLTFRIIISSISPGSARWWPALIGGTLLASAPQALATRAGAFWLWPELAQLRLPLLLWFAQTATLGLISTAAVGFIRRRPAFTPRDDLAPPPTAAPGDAPLDGNVLALQMEDHYVRVHRPTGSELILMPMNRAIACVGAEGLRTHRSWWVASHAVAAVEGNARSMRLLLSNGLVAPVARSAVIRLKAAGWIADAQGGANRR